MFTLSHLDAYQIRALLLLLVATIVIVPIVIDDIIAKRKIKKRLAQILNQSA